MIYDIFKGRGFPSYVSEIVERKLKRKIISVETFSNDRESQRHIILTDRGYLSLRSSVNKKTMQTEKAVLELCKNQGIPVPSIILYEELYDRNGESFTIIEDITGEPFITKKLLIFDYDRILAQLAEILIKIHSIRLVKFGYLTPTLVGTRNSWYEFLMQGIDIQLRTLSKKGIFSRGTIKRISKTLDFKPKKAYPILLHGHISTTVVYVDSNLRICNIINFTQSLSGDPNYEMAGFLVYEGFDRAKRLIRRYHSLGGSVTWDSEELLKTSVRRAIASLHWAIETKQLNRILPRRELLVALIAKSKT